MSLPTKTISICVIGCASAASIGLLQAKASSTIREQLGVEGYELISEKEKVSEKAWKKRVELYKDKQKDLLLPNLPIEGINENKLKEACSKYEKNNIRVNDVGAKHYEKITVLCTLNVGEYIESHLNTEDTIITDNEEDWKANFSEHEAEIKKDFNTITPETAKTTLSKFCLETFELKHSNENKEKRIKANLWCVKRKKIEPAPKAPAEDKD